MPGKLKLYRYCRERGLPHKRIGKLIVARDNEQVSKLQQLLKNGRANGVSDLKASYHPGALNNPTKLHFQIRIHIEVQETDHQHCV